MSSKTTNLDKMKEGFSRAATASRNKFSSIIEPGGAEISAPHHKSPSKNRSTTHHSLFLTGEINRGGGGGGKDGGTSGRPRADSNGGGDGEFHHHSSSSSIESIAECLKYLLDDESELLSLALRKKLATPTTPRSASPRASCPPSSSSSSTSTYPFSPLLASGEDTSQFTAGALLANHANGFPLFYDFMESSFAEEHINFLADVGQFKRQMVGKAESIFNKYFKNSELSCDEFTKQEISQEIKTRSINVNLFSRASAEVLHLIVDLYYPRFAATEHYNHWKG
jgi:hypothetical protein